jgi:hypothetical protein
MHAGFFKSSAATWRHFGNLGVRRRNREGISLYKNHGDAFRAPHGDA